MSKRQPKGVKNRPERAAEVGIELWEELEIGKLSRDRHVRSCLLCKALVMGCAASGEDEYIDEAAKVIRGHIKTHKAEKYPKGSGCEYDGCILHEEVSRELALEMIRLGNGDEPWRDIRGVQVSCMAFLVRKDDHPPGFDMTKQDVVHRAFKYLPPAAGEVYFRLGPKKVMVHVSVTPAYVSRHENVEDAPAIADIVKVNNEIVPVIREWVLPKYHGLKKLAEGELAEQKPKEEKA